MSKYAVTVDVDLLKKYNKPGPRYTSYPTAPHFHPGIDADAYVRHIAFDEQHLEKRALSLYFHIPFCDTLCYFCGCNMMVSRNQDRINTYLSYLEKEMELLKAQVGPDRKVIQMHWGGGTPTHLNPDQIHRLGAAIHRNFDFLPEAEVSVEIDPRELRFEHLQALADNGFNRCSMGVQDFDPKVQKAVNRIQPESITRDAIEWARKLGFNSLNLDLMYGLPHQHSTSFAKTLRTILDLQPDRLAVFSYAHLPGMIKHQRLIKDEWLPDSDEKLDLLKLSIDQLSDAGYVYIGMDHFAKPEDELTVAMNNGTLYRNFQGYSTHAGINVFAFGISGIGMLSDLYVQNHKTLDDYYAAIDQGTLPVKRGVALSNDDQLRRAVITTLMCHFKVDKSAFGKAHNINFDAYFSEALLQLKELEKDGLVEVGNDLIQVSSSGRLLIRNIAMCFDTYLNQAKTGKSHFSKTV